MSWLSKGIKKARKALHLPAITLGNVAKVALPLATGGLGAGALALGAVKSRLKSQALGGVKQILKTKAEKAVVDKVKKLLPTQAAVSSSPKAQAMPGGAPVAGRTRSSTKRGRLLRATGLQRAAAARTTARTRKRRTGAKRGPPKGGKDFKALSASWKAAGKPGTWLAWVKSH